MSRHHHHALLCRTHTRRHDMENSFSISRHNRLCCQHESHERAPSRWHSPLSPFRRRYFRATCSTRSLHNRRRPGKRHNKSTKRPRCRHDWCASLYIPSTSEQLTLCLPDTIGATLSSKCSLLLPCDAGPRLLELLVLLDQHWKYADFRYPICLLSRNGREMLTFVRSMMEWVGGTVSKEDVGVDGSGKTGPKRRRADDEADDEALGAFALRFKCGHAHPPCVALTFRSDILNFS